ncbi:MAG: DUF5953 family protein [Myxococcota bacterium]
MPFFFTDMVDESRYRAMLSAIESTLPTGPLVYRITEAGEIARLAEPAAWFMSRLGDGAPSILCNGDAGEYVGFSVIPSPVLSLHSLTADRPQIEFQLLLQWPWTSAYVAQTFALVRSFGPCASAHWGVVSDEDSTLALKRGIGRQSSASRSATLSPRPRLTPCWVSWIAYWSEATCAVLDFGPDDTRTELFHRVAWIAGHGVVLQLTADSLDVERPEHLAAISALYRAFPEL